MSRAAQSLANWLGKASAGSEAWNIRMALQAQAQQQENVIDLTRGDPDLETPPNIVEAGIKAIRDGKTHYTPPPGLPALRRAIAEKLRHENQIPAEPAGVMVTSGVMEGLSIVLRGLLDPGDEVLLGDPNYPGYTMAILMAGGVPRFVPAGPGQNYFMTPEALEPYITPRTKALLLVTPSNPAGSVYDRKALEDLSAWVQRHDLILLADEIYERYVFAGAQHISSASLPGMADRTITINGFSKSFCMTGWRLGYVAGPPDFIKGLNEIRYAYSICAAEFTQWAGLAALTEETRPHEDAIVAEFGRRRELFVKRLNEADIAHANPVGGYFVVFEVAPPGEDGVEASMNLLKKAGLHTWPGGMFGSTIANMTRAGLVLPAAVLEEAADRLGEWKARIG